MRVVEELFLLFDSRINHHQHRAKSYRTSFRVRALSKTKEKKGRLHFVRKSDALKSRVIENSGGLFVVPSAIQTGPSEFVRVLPLKTEVIGRVDSLDRSTIDSGSSSSVAVL